MRDHDVTADCYDRLMAKRPLGKHFLRQWREAKNLSLRGLAAKLESTPGEPLMSHANIGRIEKFQQPYSQEILEAVSSVFKCSVVDILTVDPTGTDLDERNPETQLRLAMLAFGVDRDELDQVVDIVNTFVHGEKPAESPSPERSPSAIPHREPARSKRLPQQSDV